MLYNMDWLQPGKQFPPKQEQERIVRYHQNARLFDGDHFDDPEFRSRVPAGISAEVCVNLYHKCAERIAQVIGNWDEVISFPTLLNYQRLMTLKVADLVCGEHPTVSGVTPKENAAIRDVRDESDFDAKLYATVIDISRYGDAIWRVYKDYDSRMNFTPWDPTQWYPIVRQDGTNTITDHCLCWIENRSTDAYRPDYYLHAQIHSVEKPGSYTYKVFKMDTTGDKILKQVSSKEIKTGLNQCAIYHLKAFTSTNSIYGYDDYMPLDSILAEIMTRVGQISAILDKHADPNITGPVSMLKRNEATGELYLEAGKFYAISPGEEKPEYMTWDGQLSSAFKQLEFLVNQMYILSEMGAALLGGQDGSSQAISGTAMRFKMVNPLAKVRRIANSLSRPVRQLFSVLSTTAEVDESEFEIPESTPQAIEGEEGTAQPTPKDKPLVLPIPYRKISVFWADGLPDDPRENIENCKLATGSTKMMPLEKGIMEFFGRSNEEALQWIDSIRKETEANMQVQSTPADGDNPNKSGPQDGTGVNPRKKGSDTGLKNFHSPTNK
jgi:hypothetical protein